MLIGTTAAALSTALVIGHATNTTADNLEAQLAAIAIGIGGRGDPDAVNIPNKISGTVIPPMATYIPVHYPAGFDIDNSVAAGQPVLHQIITDNLSNGTLIVVSYSEGTIIAENEKRALAVGGHPANVVYTMIASPNVPNGGIFSRFPTLTIPFFVTSNGPAQPVKTTSEYFTNEYDTYADFPAYFNLVSLANTVVAIQYVHPDQYYDSDVPGSLNELTKTVPNSAGGTDIYHFYLADHLPLFAPVRQIAGIVGLTPLTEPILGAIEPLVRLIVDMGYTDRLNLNPEVPIQFSFFTPPERILATLAGIPGAITEGTTNLVTGITSIPSSIPTPLAPPPSTTLASTNSRLAPESPNKLSLTDSTPLSLTKEGPTLGKLTDDGGKVTPGGSGKTAPESGSPATEVSGGSQTPSSSTLGQPSAPQTGPTPGSTPAGETSATTTSSQGQSSNAA